MRRASLRARHRRARVARDDARGRPVDRGDQRTARRGEPPRAAGAVRDPTAASAWSWVSNSTRQNAGAASGTHHELREAGRDGPLDDRPERRQPDRRELDRSRVPRGHRARGRVIDHRAPSGPGGRAQRRQPPVRQPAAALESRRSRAARGPGEPHRGSRTDPDSTADSRGESNPRSSRPAPSSAMASGVARVRPPPTPILIFIARSSREASARRTPARSPARDGGLRSGRLEAVTGIGTRSATR